MNQIRRGAATGGALVALALAAAMGAQEPSLAQLESIFDSAVLEHDAALSAAQTQQQILEESLQTLDAVRISGDEEATDAAFLAVQREAQEFQRLELRVQETRSAADEARQELLAGLDRRRVELEGRQANAASAVVARQFQDLLEDVNRQYDRLEEEPLSDVGLEVLYSSITYDPRDRAPMLRYKAELLERRVQLADTVLREVDLRIERLEGRLRIQQTREDFRAGVGRFDDDLLRTGTARALEEREEGMPTDSVEVQEAAPLPQQIEEAQALREVVLEYRTVLAVRAEDFRDRLRRIGS